MRARRLITTTMACAAVVLGISILVTDGRAQAGGHVRHTCSPGDRQFLDSVRSQMTYLGYWSDALVGGDVAPGVVVRQARSEAAQVTILRPTDPTLRETRALLGGMFTQYARAISARMHGGNAGLHMQLSYTLANEVHDLLTRDRAPLASRGCDPAPLLRS